MGRCAGKKRYPTKGYARAALKTARKRGADKHGPAPRSYYPCTYCGGYHLTSMRQPKDAVTSQKARGIT